MMNWLSANGGTVLVSFILIVIVSRIVISLRNKKKPGISSCGCNCGHCAMSNACHKR